MIARYRALGGRIQEELQELGRVASAVQRHWQQALTAAADQDAYINSVALNLHGWYSGLERVFELVAIELDGGALGGADWQAELMRQMTLDLRPVRPAVLQKATIAQLDEYRKFRHRIRNIYSMNLDPARMARLVADLPELWDRVSDELLSLVSFLNELSDSDRDS